MELLEQKLKEYIASVAVPKEAEPGEMRKVIEENADITAGMFLKRLKELKENMDKNRKITCRK